MSKKLRGIFEKKSHKAEKGGKVHSVERGPICFGMVLYFILEALDAFNLWWKCTVHKKWADPIELTKKASHCKSRAFSSETVTLQRWTNYV